MNDRTPECCQKCNFLKKDGGCRSNGVRCKVWQEWFREEWTGIRIAAGRLKQEQEEEASRNGEK